MMRKKFNVKGMTCAACQSHVYNAVSKLDDARNINVNLIANTLELETDNLKDIEIISAVKKAGYDASVFESLDYKSASHNRKTKLTLSIIFWAMLMIFSMGSMFDIPLLNFFMSIEGALWYSLIQIILLAPIVILNFHYFTNGFKRLFKLTPNMDSLVAIGSCASIIYGIYGTIMIIIGLQSNNQDLIHKYQMDLYFEGAGTILTLVSIGKFIELFSKNKTSESLKILLDLTGKKTIRVSNNVEEEIDVDNISIDDTLKIMAGMAIPVDGIIIKGEANVDESSMTGEPLPVFKKVNDNVISGTINNDGVILIKTTSTSKDSTISKIVEMIENVSKSKAPLTRIVDKVSSIFVPVVIGLSLISFIIWMIINKDFSFAISIAISVLVISCPCALGLATPIAAMIASGIGARNHLLFKSHEALEKLSSIDTVVFDKTGTITKGQFNVVKVNSFDDRFLSILYNIEKDSTHPLAKAIVSYCSKLNVSSLNIKDVTTFPGKGIMCSYDNDTYYAGNKTLFDNTDLDLSSYDFENHSVIILGTKTKLLGYVLISDTVKENSKFAISLFKKNNIKTIMLTGDNLNNANYIKNLVDIDEVYADVLPSQKADIILNLEKDHNVLMVGDGINDSIALEAASVGMAIGAGSDVALESANIILSRNDLLDAYNAYKLSCRTTFNIKLNLFWAFFYNSIAIPIAMGVLYIPFGIKLNPMIASLAMCLSSISVVLTALTLFKFKKVEVKKMETLIRVEGMMCPHCEKHVKDALLKVEGIIEVIPSFKNSEVLIKHINELDLNKIKEIISKEGYIMK